MANDMEIKLARLETIVQAGFTEVRASMERGERRQEQSHAENIHRLDKIDSRADAVHTKADGLAAAVAVLMRELERVRENYHNLRGWLLGVHPEAHKMPPVVKDSKESITIPAPVGEQRAVTQGELKWIIGLIVTCIGIGAGVTLWILKVAGKLG